MIRVLDGDMRDVVPTLDRIDCVVTDPPYHLTSGNAGYDLDKTSAGTPRVRRQARGGGFMGKQWDGGTLAFEPDTWWPVFTAMKPGAHLVAFGGTRTFHRMVCAIEDAGFEIRDTLLWLYGTGFPKSHNISAAIDKAAGAEREVVGVSPRYSPGRKTKMWSGVEHGRDLTAPATPEAAQWQGWGSALKPAMELICLARKPLEGTLAQNTLKHGVGGLNIDACRVPADDGQSRARPPRTPNAIYGGGHGTDCTASPHNPAGRWPANVILSDDDEVLEAFATFGERTSGTRNGVKNERVSFGDDGTFAERARDTGYSRGASTGSAARFFFSAKADKSDRADSRHPTVKPVDLMRWLVRLVCPPGGTVLDPFAGSGSTGEAAMLEGMNVILIEKDAQHAADIRHRIRRWSGEDCPLFATAAD